MTNTKSLKLSDYWYLFFLLCGAGGIFVIIRLLSLPADPGNQFLMGYSLNRLLMVSIAIGGSAGFAFLAFKTWRHQTWRERWLNPERYPQLYPWLMFFLGFAALLSWSSLFVLRLYPEGIYLAVYQRLQPMLLWSFSMGILGVLWLALLRFGIHWRNLLLQKPLFRLTLWVLAGFTILALYSLLTGVGLDADIVDWNGPGVPLLAWQIWAGFALSGLVLILSLHPFFTGEKNPDSANVVRRLRRLDIIMALFIWLLSTTLWLSQPITRSYFTPEPRQPNLEFYPFSDAADHDIIAQHILLGDGFVHGSVVKRSLLAAFLAGLHAIGGQDYQQVIALQTLVLACFPVVLYFLGRQLHGRPLGGMLALLALLREVNSIAATPVYPVSHSKMLMSDLPTALGISLFTLFVVFWFQKPDRRWFWALAAGGVLGLTTLIRTQSLLLAGLVIPAAWLSYRRAWRPWLTSSLAFILGISLSVAPWLLRSYVLTGRFVFEQSTAQVTWMAQRYSLTPNQPPPQLPDEPWVDYQDRLLVDMNEFIRTRPLYVASFFSAHTLNNLYSAALVLPLRSHVNDLPDALTITRVFWGSLGEGISWQSKLLLALNLSLTALGLAALIRRWGITGAMPLILMLGYALSNAVARNSGWRYMLPTDWVGYFYYAAGLLELFGLVLLLFSVRPAYLSHAFSTFTSPEATHIPDRPIRHWYTPDLRKAGWLGIGFLLIGSILPLIDITIPARFPQQNLQQLEHSLLTYDPTLDTPTLESFLQGENAVFAYGRVLYPRFYYPGEGEAGNAWVVYQPSDRRHLAFVLIGQKDYRVTLPLAESPAYFPNAVDAYLLGCEIDDYVEASLVLIVGLDGSIHRYQAATNDHCPAILP